MTGCISFQSSDSRTSPQYALMKLGHFIRTVQMQQNNNQFLNVTSVSARYQVSTTTIWRWVREGCLPNPIKFNGSTRWRVSDLNNWESQQNPIPDHYNKPHP